MSKETLAQALRDHPNWGNAFLAERERADRLAAVVKDVWGSLLAYHTDLPEPEVQRLVSRCESVNELIEGRVA